MQDIREITPTAVHAQIEALSGLLRDAVDSGASVGFVWPLEEAEVHRYWRGVVSAMNDRSRRLFAAFADGQLVGSVQLDLAIKANARHRAEVQKLLVHRQARRRGIARALMMRIEDLALSLGRTLLVIDVRVDDPAAAAL